MKTNLEDALKKTDEHDHIDPEYAKPMGQRAGAPGGAGTLLKVNHASEQQVSAYDNYFKENDERHLNDLKELVAIQSMAMAPEHAPDVHESRGMGQEKAGRHRYAKCHHS